MFCVFVFLQHFSVGVDRFEIIRAFGGVTLHFGNSGAFWPILSIPISAFGAVDNFLAIFRL